MLPPLLSHLSFSILPATRLFYQTKDTRPITNPLPHNPLPAPLISIPSHLPLPTALLILLLLLTLIFLITTPHTISFSISMSLTGDGDPPKIIRLF
ncbi:BCCT family transporter, partial [Staphylococcus saprophyticus]|uniref:BCCT family transporter n=1 Tax=Staphylococcus saprophyticus TaxID=29385 RepID=UPI0021B22435